MIAILSDIHGNLEALKAVLADIDRFPVEAIYCLGDVVGYGPNPRECIDLAMQWKVVLLGNHDHAVVFGGENLGAAAERASRWTTRQLEAPVPNREAAAARLGFLAERPHSYQEDDLLFVHGSPRKPLNEYVFPEDIYNPPKLNRIFANFERCCFCGHTHLPGVFTEEPRHYSPEDVDNIYHLDHHKALCNVGSVGQPRDGDWRACYVLLDDNGICFRRIEYDVDTTVRKIRAIGELDDFLGDGQ